jgi:hypothetical protein
MDYLTPLHHDQHGVSVTHLDFVVHAMAEAEQFSSGKARSGNQATIVMFEFHKPAPTRRGGCCLRRLGRRSDAQGIDVQLRDSFRPHCDCERE